MAAGDRGRKKWDWAAIFAGIGLYGTIIAIIWIASSFSTQSYAINPDDPDVILIKSEWWGLRRKEIRVAWVKADGEDEETWCVKDSKGKWHPLMFLEDDREFETRELGR